MKVTRTWRKVSGEVVTRVYDYPEINKRKYTYRSKWSRGKRPAELCAPRAA